MRFIRLIVRRVVRGLGHLDFSILSLNGDSKVPIFLFLSVPFCSTCFIALRWNSIIYVGSRLLMLTIYFAVATVLELVRNLFGACSGLFRYAFS